MSNSDIAIPTTGISLRNLFTNSNYAAFTGSLNAIPANEASFSKMRTAKYDSSNTDSFSINTEIKGKKVGLINSVIAGNNVEKIFFNISTTINSSNINDYRDLLFDNNVSPEIKEHPIFYEDGDFMQFVIDRINNTVGNLKVFINNSPSPYTNYTSTQFQSTSFPPNESRFKVDFEVENYASNIFSTTEPINIEFLFD